MPPRLVTSYFPKAPSATKIARLPVKPQPSPPVYIVTASSYLAREPKSFFHSKSIRGVFASHIKALEAAENELIIEQHKMHEDDQNWTAWEQAEAWTQSPDHPLEGFKSRRVVSVGGDEVLVRVHSCAVCES